MHDIDQLIAVILSRQSMHACAPDVIMRAVTPSRQTLREVVIGTACHTPWFEDWGTGFWAGFGHQPVHAAIKIGILEIVGIEKIGNLFLPPVFAPAGPLHKDGGPAAQGMLRDNLEGLPQSAEQSPVALEFLPTDAPGSINLLPGGTARAGRREPESVGPRPNIVHREPEPRVRGKINLRGDWNNPTIIGSSLQKRSLIATRLHDASRGALVLGDGSEAASIVRIIRDAKTQLPQIISVPFWELIGTIVIEGHN